MMEDVKPTLNPYNRLNVIETKLNNGILKTFI